jgi:hypothetical protein
MLNNVYGVTNTQENEAKKPNKCHYVNIYVVSGNKEDIFVKVMLARAEIGVR